MWYLEIDLELMRFPAEWKAIGNRKISQIIPFLLLSIYGPICPRGLRFLLVYYVQRWFAALFLVPNMMRRRNSWYGLLTWAVLGDVTLCGKSLSTLHQACYACFRKKQRMWCRYVYTLPQTMLKMELKMENGFLPSIVSFTWMLGSVIFIAAMGLPKSS